MTVPDKGDRFAFIGYKSMQNKSCYTLEFDIKFEEIKANASTAMQIRMGNYYMLTVGVSTSGTITFGDSSATNAQAITNRFAGNFKADEWHRVKVVFCLDGGTPQKTLVYVDEKLIGESDNYIGKENGKLSAFYDEVYFYALFSTDFTVVFDNISTDATNDTQSSN